MIAAAGVAVLIVATLSRRPKEVFLAAYILALTYNRQFFSFDDIFGPSGYQSFYWTLADPFLILLFATSALERAPAGAPQVAAAPKIASGAGPVLFFLIACCLSALAAERPDWAFNEVFRVLKFALLLAWLHRNLTPRLWLTAAVTLGVAVALQSSLGIVQAVTNGGTSLLSMIGIHREALQIAPDIDTRARGTLGHANYLAPYLLMLVPPAFGIALFSRHRQTRFGGALVALLGAAGIIASQSRAPIVLLFLTLFTTTALGISEAVISLRAALGGAIIFFGLAVVMAAPFVTTIEHRLTGDFVASIDFRAEYDTIAVELWNDHPLLGIGLNNTMLGLQHNARLYEKIAVGLDMFRDLPHARPASVHNVYLLILSETGAVGLAAFLVLLVAVLRRAVTAAASSSGAMRGLCLAATIGLVAQYTQQLVDFSLWGDASWYTFGVLAGLLGSVPEQMPTIR
jgi:O-antigen ligase